MEATMTIIEVPAKVHAAVRAVAERRNAEQRAAGQVDGLVATHSKSSLDADVEGALGEYAVAQAMGLEWDGAFLEHRDWQRWRTEGHDVSGVEVRTTTHSNGRLIVQPHNPDDSPYVLVVLTRDHTRADLRGWLWGHEVKHHANWQAHWPKPTFAAAQSDLRPVNLLQQLWNGTWWLSTERMTGHVRVRNGRVCADQCTPIWRKFVGQPLTNLVRWLRKQPGFRGQYLS